MEQKRILTLSDLVQFCQDHQLYSFNAKETGYPLCVQFPSTFKQFDEEDNESALVYADVIVMHTGRNRNKSNVTVDAAKKAIRNFAYKPILANFYTDPETGERDFSSHDFEIDKDGNIIYQEHQVGCFTTDEPYLEQDPDNKDRQYIYAKCAIPKEYTDTVDIIQRKNGTKCSAELIVNSMSYDSKNKELLLTDIELSGLTLLGKYPDGTDVQEGMEGARVDLADFSIENNSIVFDHDKALEIMQELKTTLDNYITAQAESKKGGQDVMEIFEENVEVTNTPEEETVVEQMAESEKEVEEAATEESTEEVTVTEAESEETTDVTPSDEDFADNDLTDNFATLSVTINGETRTFSASLIEKLNALSNLINQTYSESDNDYYDVDADEEKKEVFAHGWWGGKHFKQKYSVKKDVYTLQGDRVDVYARYLTQDEINQLDQMKSNYAAISEKLAKYEAEPEKMEILNSDDYSQIKNTEQYSELLNNHFDLNKEELTNKLDTILLNYAKNKIIEFSSPSVDKQPVSMKKLPIAKSSKSGRYGGLFSKN